VLLFTRLLWCDGESLEEIMEPIRGIPIERLERVGKALSNMGWDKYK